MKRITYDIRLKVVCNIPGDSGINPYPEHVKTLQEIAAFEKLQIEKGAMSLYDLVDISEITELNVTAEEVEDEQST